MVLKVFRSGNSCWGQIVSLYLKMNEEHLLQEVPLMSVLVLAKARILRDRQSPFLNCLLEGFFGRRKIHRARFEG